MKKCENIEMMQAGIKVTRGQKRLLIDLRPVSRTFRVSRSTVLHILTGKKEKEINSLDFIDVCVYLVQISRRLRNHGVVPDPVGLQQLQDLVGVREDEVGPRLPQRMDDVLDETDLWKNNSLKNAFHSVWILSNQIRSD